MMISILAIIGLAGLILGFWSIFYVDRSVKSDQFSPNWKKLRLAVLITGLLIGVLSWPATFFMGYPVSYGTKTIRVVGIPFIVAYFDSTGRDYVGALTFISLIGNGIFWFLLPHIFLAIYLRRFKRHNTSRQLSDG